jgi:hypothetical protein
MRLQPWFATFLIVLAVHVVIALVATACYWFCKFYWAAKHATREQIFLGCLYAAIFLIGCMLEYILYNGVFDYVCQH